MQLDDPQVGGAAKMDVELLKTVGEVAGLGGLAVGALVLIFREVIRKRIFPKLPSDAAYRLLRLIVIAAWSISALGILTWAYVTKPAASAQISQNLCSPLIVGDIMSELHFDCRPSAAKSVAEKNFDRVRSELRLLYMSQNGYLFPAMNSYVNRPTEKMWRYAKHEVARTQGHLDAAIDAALTYDASLKGKLGPTLTSLHEALSDRGFLLAELPDEPPDQNFVISWAAQYRKTLKALEKELEALEKLVKDSGEQSKTTSGSVTGAATE